MYFFPSFLLRHPFLPSAWSFSLNRKREIELKSAFDISSLLQINKMIRLSTGWLPPLCQPPLPPPPSTPSSFHLFASAAHPTPLLWLESGNPFAVLLSDLTQAVSGSLCTSPLNAFSPRPLPHPLLSPPFPFLSFALSFRLYPPAVCCRLCGEFAQITCHTGSYV